MRKSPGVFAAAVFALAAATGLATASAPVRAAEVLQTQMGIAGELEADVVKAKVDGNVLTVVVMFRNTTDKRVERLLELNDVFFIDAAGAKKYMLLRDAGDRPVAGPLNHYSGHAIDMSIGPKGRLLVWMKFPAPPADSATINLTLPITLPFDDLKVQR